jgi:hypothetical protein
VASPFVARLRELGWVDGDKLGIAYQSADGRELAAEWFGSSSMSSSP